MPDIFKCTYSFPLTQVPNVDWRGIANIAFADVENHFTHERGPSGNWTNLKPATWARKTSPMMLYETGDYWESWESTWDTSSAEVFSTSKLSMFHEYGTKVGGKKRMPKRQIAYLSQRALRDLGHIFADAWIKGVFKDKNTTEVLT